MAVTGDTGKTGANLDSGSMEDALPTAMAPPAAMALVFAAAGAVLMLEILAVRLLAPYVGLTLTTTTSIIGAALAGIAIGAAGGGYLADRTHTRTLIVGLLIGGGLLTLLVVPTVRWLGPGVRGGGDLAALGITTVALVPAAVVLSAVSPAVAHLQLHNLHNSGTIVGRLSAFATAGALVGTFGTGFILVPLVPVSAAVLGIGLALIAIGIVLGASSRLVPATAIAGVIALTLGFGALTAASASPCDRETAYHCAVVERLPEFPGRSYLLTLDGESNSVVNLDDPTELDFRYTRWIADSINSRYRGKEPLDAVFVGGGAFSLPRWLNGSRPGSKSMVLEIDGGTVDLDEEKLDLRTSPDLEVMVGDARITILDVPSKSADVVVGDAFSGLTVPWHLTTAEWLQEVKRVLKPDGVYAMNLVDNTPLEFLEAEASTFLDAFSDVRMITPVGANGEPINGNTILLGSVEQMPKSVGSSAYEARTFQNPEVEAFAAGADSLDDDYAPVDQLLTVKDD
jgi:MFS family permease/ubiquinone/menaquinone biosynthesis C-methylase UbiE